MTGGEAKQRVEFYERFVALVARSCRYPHHPASAQGEDGGNILTRRLSTKRRHVRRIDMVRRSKRI